VKIKLEDLKNYKVNENQVVTPADVKHIENYRQLIKFFESALADSTHEGKTDFPKLLGACIQCIRYLDGIVSSYDIELLSARNANSLIDTIVKNNTPVTSGNEESEQDLKSKE
jgi:hypothetical protein